MTIRRPKQGSVMPTKGNVYGLNLNTPKAPKSPGVVAPPAPPTPTPDVQNVGIAGVSDSELEPVGVSGVTEDIKENNDLGVAGVPESIEASKAPKVPEAQKETTQNSLGVSGVKEAKQESKVGVAAPVVTTVAKTVFLKKFNPPRRMLAMPSWNSIVTYNTIKPPNAGTLFNSETTYAEWYTAFAIAAIDDDYIAGFGIITRRALPELWPSGPKQALFEASQAGIQIGPNGILQPGEAFFKWMFETRVNPWLRGYIDAKYPNGISILGGL